MTHRSSFNPDNTEFKARKSTRNQSIQITGLQYMPGSMLIQKCSNSYCVTMVTEGESMTYWQLKVVTYWVSAMTYGCKPLKQHFPTFSALPTNTEIVLAPSAHQSVTDYHGVITSETALKTVYNIVTCVRYEQHLPPPQVLSAST